MIHVGDVSAVLPTLETESFDAVLSDPPYGLGFMGKAWDHGVPGPEVWTKVYALLKPGAFLLAFGGTRTSHRLVSAIEDAGFEIRDSLVWIHGQGFPKSLSLRSVGPEWEGYGTAIKPAHEPICLAMKPCRGTFAENAQAFGVAGLNVDGGRIGVDPGYHYDRKGGTAFRQGLGPSVEVSATSSPLGRFPANVLLDAEAGRALDEMSGERVSGGGNKNTGNRDNGTTIGHGLGAGNGLGIGGDSGGASRFFYCAKASRSEREAGLEALRETSAAERTGRAEGSAGLVMEGGKANPFAGNSGSQPARNHHPTVKPIDLAHYLATLILPPKRETPRRLLVPFSGSGSEMIGALLAGWDEVVGIEREPEYAEIAKARLSHWTEQKAIEVDKETRQLSLIG